MSVSWVSEKATGKLPGCAAGKASLPLLVGLFKQYAASDHFDCKRQALNGEREGRAPVRRDSSCQQGLVNDRQEGWQGSFHSLLMLASVSQRCMQSQLFIGTRMPHWQKCSVDLWLVLQVWCSLSR